MKTTIEFLGDNVDIKIVKRNYDQGGATALIAMDDEGQFGVITVNNPRFQLDDDEIIVKTWSENEWVTQLLQKLPNVFQDTGKRIPMGYAEGQIWKFREAA